MREFLTDLFTNYSLYIVFIHVLSAVLWVGGMIALRFIVSPILKLNLEDKKVIDLYCLITSKFLKFILIFILLLIITAVIMIIGMDLSHSVMSKYSHAKEGIWTVMFIIYIVIAFYTKSISKSSTFEALNKIKTVQNILLPLTIVLGIIAIFIGVMLRGF